MQDKVLNGRGGYTVPRSEVADLGVPVVSSQSEETFPIKDLLQVIWRRLWVIALVTLVLVGSAVGYGFLQTPTYEASSKILVGQGEQNERRPGDLGGELQGLQQVTQTMVEAVNSRPVAEAVIRQLGLELSPEAILEHLNVEQVGATQFIQVEYRDQNPERAQEVSNAVGDVFSSEISEVSPSASYLTATVWERASVPQDPVSPDFMRIVPLALMIGLMLGVGLAFLLEYLDDSWRSPDEVEQLSGVPTFGIIPRFKPAIGATKKGKNKVRG